MPPTPPPAAPHGARTARPRRRSRAALAVGCTTVLLGVAGCGGDDPTVVASGTPSAGPSTVPAPTSPAPDATATPSVTAVVPPRAIPPQVSGEIATGLDSPWSIAFLPDGDALVSQRDDGSIVQVTPDGTVTPVGDVPDVFHSGEGGLLGLAVSPSFATDRLVYAYLTSSSDNRIVRMTYEGGRLGTPEVVLDGIESNTFHNGGRIKFGPDGMLYAGTGDAGNPDSSQDRDSVNGKILRMTPDGGVPADNPFGTLVWSYGHRNVQGFGWADDGTMWADEFGQNTWDELNLIQPGANYGWPVVEGQEAADGMTEPVEQWPTDDASPSGLAVVDGQVYLAALRGERLWHVPVPGGTSSLEPTPYLVGDYGRLRDVVAAPDGSLWVLTNNTDGRGDPRDGDDRILRVQRLAGGRQA